MTLLFSLHFPSFHGYHHVTIGVYGHDFSEDIENPTEVSVLSASDSNFRNVLEGLIWPKHRAIIQSKLEAFMPTVNWQRARWI